MFVIDVCITFVADLHGEQFLFVKLMGVQVNYGCLYISVWKKGGKFVRKISKLLNFHRLGASIDTN